MPLHTGTLHLLVLGWWWYESPLFAAATSCAMRCHRKSLPLVLQPQWMASVASGIIHNRSAPHSLVLWCSTWFVGDGPGRPNLRMRNGFRTRGMGSPHSKDKQIKVQSADISLDMSTFLGGELTGLTQLKNLEQSILSCKILKEMRFK